MEPRIHRSLRPFFDKSRYHLYLTTRPSFSGVSLDHPKLPLRHHVKLDFPLAGQLLALHAGQSVH
jgi:hypothetical protein